MIDRLPAPFRVIARAFILWWDGVVNLAVLNLVCGIAWFTIILGPPATFGLYDAINELGHGRSVGLRGMIASARRYFVQSWLWLLPNLLALVAVSLEGPFFVRYPFFLPITAAILILWLIVQFYALPYFMEQADKNILVAWRNGLFTAFASPFFTLVFFWVSLALLVACVVLVLPLFLGGVSLLACLGTLAVLNRIDTFGLRRPPSST